MYAGIVSGCMRVYPWAFLSQLLLLFIIRAVVIEFNIMFKTVVEDFDSATDYYIIIETRRVC